MKKLFLLPSFLSFALVAMDAPETPNKRKLNTNHQQGPKRKRIKRSFSDSNLLKRSLKTKDHLQGPAKKKRKTEADFTKALPTELQQYLFFHLITGKKLEDDIANIVRFGCTNKALYSLLQSPKTFEALNKKLMEAHPVRPVANLPVLQEAKIATLFGTKEALCHLKKLHKIKIFDAQSWIKRIIENPFYSPSDMQQFNSLLKLEVFRPIPYQSNSFPLNDIVGNGNIKLLKITIANNYPVNFAKNVYKNAFIQAAWNDDIEIMKLLLEQIKDKQWWSTDLLLNPLMRAVQKKNSKAVAFLLQNNAPCEQENGLVPLITAISKNNKQIIQLLLEYGANVNIIDWMGQTPLHVKEINNEILRFLLDHGASVDLQDCDGNTSLHINALYNQKENIELLLKCGANKNIKNKKNRTAYDNAETDEIRELLNPDDLCE